MAKNISESKIWNKIITAINNSKIKYVLVGATALVIHGLPRSTLDIDIYVIGNEANLVRLFQIAGKLGLQTEQRDILHIQHLPKLFSNQWVSFSYKGREILDIFFAAEKEFNELYKNSERKRDGRFSVRVASLKDIVAMKKSSKRSIDKADIKLIAEAKNIK